jgi:hypothetical protein
LISEAPGAKYRQRKATKIRLKRRVEDFYIKYDQHKHGDPLIKKHLFVLCMTAMPLIGWATPRPHEVKSEADSNLAPPNFSFVVPAPNACQSRYDHFYEKEPGVYAFWAMCEAGTPIQIYDYAGEWDLTKTSHAYGTGVVAGGAPGPVDDGETAAKVTTSTANVSNQNIVMNTNEGTIAVWVNADDAHLALNALSLYAIQHSSGVAIGTSFENDTLCFFGSFTNAENGVAKIKHCGYKPNTWHRVVLTWKNGAEVLSVDGVQVADGKFVGALENWVFLYKLFPGCCDTGKQMSLAKGLVANTAWDAAQVKADFAPAFPGIPVGGVFVSSTKLGVIHRGVLGYGDYNQDKSSKWSMTSLTDGLKKMGMTSVRYADGTGGIGADEANWRGGKPCVYGAPGKLGKEQNVVTDNNIDTYIPKIVQPLHLDAIYTVNYGSNPPECNAGGDPILNGADLVKYINVTKHYGIRNWEIGNELFSPTTELDLHPDPNTGKSFAKYEPAFYSAMKNVDPSIKIAVPVALGLYSWSTEYGLPVLAGASYDAVIFHSYPVKTPVTDGNTLYQDRVASNLSRVRGKLATLQTALLNNKKDPHAIWITEWNAEKDGNKWSKQTLGPVMPMFVVNQLAEYMEAGVEYATWWAQGMTGVCTNDNYDWSGETAYSWVKCGNTGLVYTGQKSAATEVNVGLKPGDITPAGRGFQLLSESGFVAEGERMLRTETDLKNAPWLLSYAATHSSGYAVILINRDEKSTHAVPVSLPGGSVSGTVRQWTYGKAQYDHVRDGNWEVEPVVSNPERWSGTYSATLPPWSVTILVFAK